MMAAGSYKRVPGTVDFFLELIAVGIAALTLVTPVAGAPHLNLTLVPQNAAQDPSVPLPVYAYGEPVVVNATLVNSGTDPVTVMGYPPKAGIHYRIAYPFRTFDRTHRAVVLEPGSSLSSQVVWDQKDGQGIRMGPGTYTVAVYYLISENASGLWDVSNLDYVSSSVDLLILPQGGAYRGTVAVNKSQTQENIIATVESFSFSNESWTANVLFRFPDNEMYSRMSTCTCPGDTYCSMAYGGNYAPDTGESRSFFNISTDCTLPGTERFVFTGEPVPADVQNISLNITTDWMNPTYRTFTTHTWNYRVNLSAPQSSPDLTPAPASTQSSTRPAPFPASLPFLATGLAFAAYAAGRTRRRS